MWLFTSTAARTALTYITVGALIVIWAGVWYVYLHNNPPETQTSYYWCSGFLVTGLLLSVIGLALSMINRAAQQATLAATAAAVNAQTNAAATPAPAPVVIPNGEIVVPAPEAVAPK